MEKSARLGSQHVFGAESTRRPDSLQRAGASGDRHQLLVRPGSDVGAMEEEALGEEERREWSELNVKQRHQRHRMRMRVRDDYE